MQLITLIMASLHVGVASKSSVHQTTAVELEPLNGTWPLLMILVIPVSLLCLCNRGLTADS